MSQTIPEFIEEAKVIAICRGIYGSPLQQLVTALEAGGVKLVEVTFDQSDKDCLEKTSTAIALLKKEFVGRVKIGAGTVVTNNQVEAAYHSGAEYIISPNCDPAVIKRTKELGLVSIPGAMTPTEILAAHQAGADFVKVFPVGALGLSYIKDIRGPINHIKLIATAGVTPGNFAEYLAAGFSGAGISNYLTNKQLVESGDFATLTQHAQELVNIAVNFHK